MAAIISSTETTTSTAVQQIPQIQTSAVEAPPPPPPPQTSTTVAAEQPAPAPTTEGGATTAIGTLSVVPTTSSLRINPLSNVAPSAPAALAPVPEQGPKEFNPVSSEVAPAISAPPTAAPTPILSTIVTAISTNPVPTSSDNLRLAEPSPSSVVSSQGPQFTAPAASAPPSGDSPPDSPGQSDNGPQASPVETSIPQRPQQPPLSTTIIASPPTGDSSAGIIAPDQGSDDSPLTLPKTNDASIGGIVGGVVGGVAILALIVGLLFFCLRKGKPSAKSWDEKETAGPRLADRLKSIPNGIGIFIAKLKGKKAGPMDNPYQRHTAQSSISSVYSQNTNGRTRSISEPHGMFAVGRSGSVRSSSSRKSERNLLRKKQSSISSDYRFPPIAESTSQQNNGTSINPFSDPEPPRILSLLNPDPSSQPVTPLAPAAVADPFASPLDPLGDGSDLRRPPIPFHRRNISSLSALSSHPPSVSLPSQNSFNETGSIPAVPTSAKAPVQTRPGYNVISSFNDMSTAASRDSNYTFYGEPGSSRPGTNLFTPGLATGRTVRQSDPFDLDRPEVLGFGDVLGRREVRSSITRQGTRSKRTSTVGNWTNGMQGGYGPYERDSAKPRPLWSAGNQR